MGSDSKSVEMDIKEDGPTSAFQLCGALIEADDEQYLDLSRQIAQKLAGAQSSRSIPGGVVVVVRGTAGPEPRHFAGVIKAEVHSGFLKDSDGGEPLLRFLSDLLLTPQQKLHKIGVFVRENDDAEAGELYADNFSAYVFDNQMSGSEITTAANYFYEGFLGCATASSARKLTRDFYTRSKEFIASAVEEDEKKVEYVTALNAYLRSPRNVIQGKEFAEEFLPDDLHQEFVDYLAQHNLPNQAITKDLTDIKRKLRLRKLSFTNDVLITAPADRFNELVSVTSEDDGTTLVRIQGTVQAQN